jgi:hypothetical protein
MDFVHQFIAALEGAASHLEAQGAAEAGAVKARVESLKPLAEADIEQAKAEIAELVKKAFA